ncbi:hypothetical protein B296_00026402 [Ensete ventricosum]|uniref:Uncharacterized protein n=1 Tax=Ensete ventricosum TaxID=4639 RepID=A0A426YBV4_ENSVE|nr:hypothetical protein B296_00026402 [Ensete ventricosum]
MESCHDVTSIVTEESLELIREPYNIPKEYVMRAPLPSSDHRSDGFDLPIPSGDYGVVVYVELPWGVLRLELVRGRFPQDKAGEPPTGFLMGDPALQGQAELAPCVPKNRLGLSATVGAPIEGEPLSYLLGVSTGYPVSIGPAWGAKDLTPTGGVGATASSTTRLGKRTPEAQLGGAAAAPVCHNKCGLQLMAVACKRARVPPQGKPGIIVGEGEQCECKNKIEVWSSSDAAIAAKVEEAAATLGAGVDALGDHEVHEAGPAAGGDEDLGTFAGVSYSVRGRGRGEGGEAGVGGVDAAFVVIATAYSGAAVIGGGDLFDGDVARRICDGGDDSSPGVFAGLRSCLQVDVVDFPRLP